MGLVLVVLFLVVPIVEIAVIVQVGQVIGPWPTVLLLVLEARWAPGWSSARAGGRGTRCGPRGRPAGCPAASSPTPAWCWSAAPCC